MLLFARKKTTVKPVLETPCIKRPPALRDHCSDTTTLLKSAPTGWLSGEHVGLMTWWL